MVSPHKSKRKADTARNHSPNLQADRQQNVQMADASQPAFQFSATSFAPPFTPSRQSQPFQPKQLVSVQTLMRHTGSKEELHFQLTVLGKHLSHLSL